MAPQTNQRWLILTQYYPPEIGAPQIRLHSLAQELQRHGIQIEVLTAMPNYPVGKVFAGYEGRWQVREVIDGIPVRRRWIYAATGKSARARLLNYLTFTFIALLVVLVERRPDMIFIESQPLSLGIVGVIMKWFRRVPYIYNIPDLQIDVAKQMGFMSNKIILRTALGMENLFLRQAFSVSTVTHRFIDHFTERGIPRSKISFLPNGADATFLRPTSPDVDMLNRWNLHGKKVFLYVGTHAYYHGLDTLIEAARLLRDREDVVILMVGSGPERSRLQAIANEYQLDNVVFGSSLYDEMARLYSVAYASVATLRNIDVAKYMRLSKIFPSMSCAVPVIYAGVGEAAELIESEQVGLATEPENPSALASTMIRLLNDPALRDRLGRNGRALIEREYAWSTITEKWLAEVCAD